MSGNNRIRTPGESPGVTLPSEKKAGGYSYLASRTISPDVDVINPDTGKPGGAIFNNSPCLAIEAPPEE